MNVDELSANIQDTYGRKLADFRAKLMGPGGLTGAHNEGEVGRMIPGLGAVQSLRDPFARVTISADRAELSWLLEQPDLGAIYYGFRGRPPQADGSADIPD